MSASRRGGSEPSTVQSVELALAILESLSDADQAKGITQLANELKTTKARIYRHMTTLRRKGYVVQEPETEKYRLALKLYFMGQSLADRFDLLALGREEAMALRNRIGQSVLISTVQDDKLVILYVARSTTTIEVGMRVGSTFPVHPTAGGRIYLAFGKVDLEAYLARQGFESYTPKTVTDARRLRAEVEKVRRQGWAGVPDEWQLGMNAISAPIFGADGALVASIALLGFVQDVPAAPSAAMLEALEGAAARISNNLGWRPGRGREATR